MSEKKTFGQRLIEGVQELVDHKEGRVSLRTTERVRVEKPRTWTRDDVVRLRVKILHASQPVFASVMATSVPTIRKWEQGAVKPPGMACRLLDLFEEHPEYGLSLVEEVRGVLSQENAPTRKQGEKRARQSQSRRAG